MELLLGALILALGFVVSAVILVNAFKEEDKETTNEFAIKHLEGYTVESVKYVRDENGNWVTVSVDYKRI